jgi:hypothetical protein
VGETLIIIRQVGVGVVSLLVISSTAQKMEDVQYTILLICTGGVKTQTALHEAVIILDFIAAK